MNTEINNIFNEVKYKKENMPLVHRVGNVADAARFARTRRGDIKALRSQSIYIATAVHCRQIQKDIYT